MNQDVSKPTFCCIIWALSYCFIYYLEYIISFLFVFGQAWQSLIPLIIHPSGPPHMPWLYFVGRVQWVLVGGDFGISPSCDWGSPDPFLRGTIVRSTGMVLRYLFMVLSPTSVPQSTAGWIHVCQVCSHGWGNRTHLRGISPRPGW